MGLLFNTAETMKMVARINKHFANDSEGGKLSKWRGKKKFFKKNGTYRLNMDTIASNEGVRVDPADDDAQETHNGKWLGWLAGLYDAPSTTLGQFYPTTVAPSATPSDVGRELSHLIFQGLDDDACREIIFSVVPATTISVDEAVKIGSTSSYSLLITVHTVEATKLKTAIKRAVDLRRRARLAAKKKA
jgi:hypothetical protein